MVAGSSLVPAAIYSRLINVKERYGKKVKEEDMEECLKYWDCAGLD